MNSTTTTTTSIPPSHGSNNQSMGVTLRDKPRDDVFAATGVVENTTTATTKATTTTKEIDDPFRFNSKTWLNETKLSNRAEDVDFVWSQILDLNDFPRDLGFASVTERSICHANSTFRKASTKWDDSDDKLISEWAFRLVYLAIHSWHHAPAADEARARRDYAKKGTANNRGMQHDGESPVEPFDFECPNTKFLVTSVLRFGMGATYRLGAVNSLLAGIATNRVTVFLNNIEGGPGKVSEQQWLASCDRQDMQCSFLPTTPCAVTKEDLVNRTHILSEGFARRVRKRGSIPDKTLDKARYVYLQPNGMPSPDQGLLSLVRTRLAEQARMMVNDWTRQEKMPQDKIRVLDKALLRLKSEDATPKDDDDAYPYTNRDSMIHHAAVVYLIRLQRDVKEQVDTQVAKVLSTGNFDASKAIGLPIRGSDKCFSESTCLPFEKYTKLAHEVWSEHFIPEEGKKGSLLITTEASDIANSSRNFQSEQLSIVMNGDDVLQDTGRPKTARFREQADEIMKSSLVALKLQLHAKHVIGNCCSNFHLLLFDLLRNGCGLVESQQCLQETKNPEYHVCCQWTKSDECDIQFGRKNVTRM